MTSADRGKVLKILDRSVVAATLIFMGIILISCDAFTIPTPDPEPTIAPKPTDSGNVTIQIKNEELSSFENIVVRVLDTQWVDTKKDDKKLILPFCGDGQYVTAWASGYYIATQPCHNGQATYEFTLTAYHVNDNAYYTWVEAQNAGQLRSCEPCHNITQGRLEYLEWQKDGHSTVFKDSYFWTMYLGMDVFGNPSPNTQWIVTDNSRHTRIIPDRSKPYYGPGFKTDYPTDNGSCAFCHAPTSVLGPQSKGSGSDAMVGTTFFGSTLRVTIGMMRL